MAPLTTTELHRALYFTPNRLFNLATRNIGASLCLRFGFSRTERRIVFASCFQGSEA
jgi:hypothetical protein